jgi:predicted permease
MGRLLTEDDVNAGAGNPVCVISYSAWQTRFGSDPKILGRKLLLNAHLYTVVGVTQPGFFGPQMQSQVDIQLPVSRMGDFMGGFFASDKGLPMWKSANFSWLELLCRLKTGVTMMQAESAIQNIANAANGEKTKSTFRLSDGSQGPNSDSQYSKPITILMGIVAVVLLIACANLAGLLLARANFRAREFAVRLSLGASRSRLIRQLMVESMTIAAGGGAVGLLLAYWIIHTLLAYLNTGRSAGSLVLASPDLSVIIFSLTLSLLTAVLFGLLPAWQSSRPDVVPELKGSAQSSRLGSLAARRFLIVFQIALSVVILFSAGLLTQTLSKLKTVDLGFDPTRVITLSVDPAMNGHTPGDADQMFQQILTRLKAQPGIRAASLAVITPLSGSMISMGEPIVPGHLKTASDRQTNYNMISPDYFSTLNQKVLAGREFNEHDTKTGPQVAIVNQFFVSQFMPGQNPVGHHIKVGDKDTEIVGLVKDSRYQSLRETPGPLLYEPTTQTTNSG